MKIYTLTVLKAVEHGRHTRTWCWYPTLAEATRAALSGNDLFLESGTYDLIVIEEIEGGYPPLGCPTWWFQAEFLGHDSIINYHVVSIEAPEWATRVINFAMG